MAADGFGPVGEPTQSTAGRVRTPEPIILDDDVQVVAIPLDLHHDALSAGMLHGVGHRLAGDEPCGGFDARRVPLVGFRDVDLYAVPRGEVVECRCQAAVREHGRVKPVCQLAQLPYRSLALLDTGSQRLPQPFRAAVEQRCLELRGQGEQPLLGAVVQIPLDSAPLLQVRGREAPPGGTHVLELKGHRGT